MVNFTASVDHTELVFPIDLPSDFTFADFRAYLSAESGVEPDDQIILLNGKELEGGNDATLEFLGLKDNDFLIIRSKMVLQQAAGASQQQRPAPGANPFVTAGGQMSPNNPIDTQQLENMRQQILNDPALRQRTETNDPQLISVLDDPVRFREAIASRMSQFFQNAGHSSAEDAELQRLSQDPDNPENQKRIMELIEQHNIEENMQNALEFTPESFTKVDMLYINVEINGMPIKAFVDSGAQATFIAPRLAEKCNLHRLIDKRFRGIAQGAGIGEILGRIHSAPLKIGGTFVPCSFTVLDTNVDMLLGLDMLRRHQANIDLKNNVLKIADTETPFLAGSDVPKDFGEEALAQTLGGANPQAVGSPDTGDNKRQRTSASSAAAQAALSRNTSSASSSAVSSVAPPSAPTGSAPQVSAPSEQSIAQLMGLGFSRAECILALSQAGGNVDLAAAILFQ